MAINDIFEMVVGQQQNGQKLVNVLHFKQVTNNVAPDPIPDLVQAFGAYLQGVWLACMSNQLSIETLKIKRVGPTVGGSFVFPIDEAGLVVEDGVPPNANVIISFQSLALGKHQRGRVYLSGVPDTFHQDGTINPAGFTVYQTLAQGLVTVVNDGAATPDFLYGIFNRATLAFSPAKHYNIRPRMSNLRSRRLENP